MNKLTRQLFLFCSLLFVVILLNGCLFSHRTKELPPIATERWLKSASCEAPCWEGIVPGVTSLYDVDLENVELINQLSKANPDPIVSGWNDTYNLVGYRYDWNIIQNGEEEGYIRATTKKYIFEKIEFSFGRNATLEDVIAHFGEPDTIGIDFVPIEWMQCRVILFFQDRRVWITVPGYTIISPYSVNIQPGSTFTAYYVSDSIRDELVNNNSYFGSEPRLYYLYNPKEQLQKWEGFKTYRCQQRWLK